MPNGALFELPLLMWGCQSRDEGENITDNGIAKLVYEVDTWLRKCLSTRLVIGERSK